MKMWNYISASDFVGVAIFLYVCHGTDGYTTAFPEVCRVMELYRDCTDVTFRVACPGLCDPNARGASGCNGLDYEASKGYCYKSTQTHTSLWVYAVEFCEAYRAELAILKTASDSDLAAVIAAASSSTQTEYFAGCINPDLALNWIYTDLEIQTSSTSNWASSYPSVDSDKLNCLWLDSSNSFKQKNDACNWNYGYFCQLDPFVNATL